MFFRVGIMRGQAEMSAYPLPDAALRTLAGTDKTVSANPHDEETFSYFNLLSNVGGYIWANLRPILISAAAALVLALTVGHFAPLQYRASVMVAAQEGLSSSGSLGGLQDLASLAGGDETSSGGSFQPFQRFTQTLTNDTVAGNLAREPGILPSLYPNEWDAQSGRWKRPGGIVNLIWQGMRAIVGLKPWYPPDEQDMQRFLERRVTVSKYGRNPAYTISLKWYDPNMAAHLLDLLLTANNTIIQHDAQARLHSTIQYLTHRLDTETQLSRRNALNRILLEQERLMMMAGAEGPYAAKIIDRMTVRPVFTIKIAAALVSFAVFFAMIFMALKFFWATSDGTAPGWRARRRKLEPM
jgi:hypothetical protein